MKEVQAAGIKFFSYDTKIEGCDAYYGWDNYDLGWAIGENAAAWVNATFDPSETVNAASANYVITSYSIHYTKLYEVTLGPTIVRDPIRMHKRCTPGYPAC